MSRRDLALAVARSWLGTPYRHQASLRGEGADCLGLVRGVWREVIGPEPQDAGPYSADWAERSGEERLLEAARVWLVELVPHKAQPGDVLLFRMAPAAPVKHCAILSGDDGAEVPAPFPATDWRARAAGGWLEQFVAGHETLRIRWDSEAGAIRPAD